MFQYTHAYPVYASICACTHSRLLRCFRVSDRLSVAFVCLGVDEDLAGTMGGDPRTRKFIGLTALMTMGSL